MKDQPPLVETQPHFNSVNSHRDAAEQFGFVADVLTTIRDCLRTVTENVRLNHEAISLLVPRLQAAEDNIKNLERICEVQRNALTDVRQDFECYVRRAQSEIVELTTLCKSNKSIH